MLYLYLTALNSWHPVKDMTKLHYYGSVDIAIAIAAQRPYLNEASPDLLPEVSDLLVVNTGGEPLHPPVLVLHPRVQVHAQLHLLHPDEGAAGGRVAAWREVHDPFVLSSENVFFFNPVIFSPFLYEICLRTGTVFR
jgi:hypothetical protein